MNRKRRLSQAAPATPELEPRRPRITPARTHHILELAAGENFTNVRAGYEVHRTPRGSLRPSYDNRPLIGNTPGGRVRRVTVSHDFLRPREEVEDIAVLDDEEKMDLMHGSSASRRHLDGWLSNPTNAAHRPPSDEWDIPGLMAPPEPLAAEAVDLSAAGSVALEASPEQLCPSVQQAASPAAGPSGVQRTAARALHFDGLSSDSNVSEFDLEYDDAIDAPDRFAPLAEDREMPPGEVPDEEATSMFLQADQQMDNAQSGLPDISFSFGWSEDYSTFTGKRDTFTGGPTGPTRSFDTPYDAFVAIWDDGIMQHITEETNRFAWQVIAGKNENEVLLPRSRFNKWFETDADELYILFAMFMIMGFTPRLRIDDYWNKSRFFNTPGIRSLMSYERYMLLNRFLHFRDNYDAVPRDELKLYKLKPIIDHCNARFQELYSLAEHMSIDESLTLWKGRLSWAQCIRTKAARFGIKSFELCESSTGYLWRFVIYTGKESGQSSSEMVAELAGKSTAIVLDLLKGLEFKGYCLTMDNFYNSPCLSRYLKTRGFDCVGTLRVNRKHVPDAIKLKQSAKAGTLVARHAGDVSVLSWKDSKVVSMISTFHDAKTSMTTKAGKPISKPIVVQDYNKYMGGVDLKDQILSMYLLERKRGLKWYIKMFKRLLNASIHNAYVLHRRSTQVAGAPVMTHRQFRVALATALVEKHSNEEDYTEPGSKDLRLRRDVVHSPANLPRANRRRCARCSARKVAKKVKTACVTCDVGLCFGECWIDFHSKSDLA